MIQFVLSQVLFIINVHLFSSIHNTSMHFKKLLTQAILRTPEMESSSCISNPVDLTPVLCFPTL